MRDRTALAKQSSSLRAAFIWSKATAFSSFRRPLLEVDSRGSVGAIEADVVAEQMQVARRLLCMRRPYTVFAREGAPSPACGRR
jgi:hypothetical protein